MSCLLTQQMSCLQAQQMPRLQTQQITCLQTQQGCVFATVGRERQARQLAPNISLLNISAPDRGARCSQQGASILSTEGISAVYRASLLATGSVSGCHTAMCALWMSHRGRKSRLTRNSTFTQSNRKMSTSFRSGAPLYTERRAWEARGQQKKNKKKLGGPLPYFSRA